MAVTNSHHYWVNDTEWGAASWQQSISAHLPQELVRFLLSIRFSVYEVKCGEGKGVLQGCGVQGEKQVVIFFQFIGKNTHICTHMTTIW